MSSSPVLVGYYAALDAGEGEAALALVHPDAAMAMTVLGSTHRGNGKQAFVDYVAGRGAVTRRHEVRRCQVDDDVEFVAGAVVEVDGTVSGHFLAAATIRDGLLFRYQVIMDEAFEIASRLSEQ